MTGTVSIALFRGPSLVSRLIRWQTRGAYNHAGLLFPDGAYYEAREFVGVRYEWHGVIAGKGERVDLFPVEVTADQEYAIKSYCHDQVGCGYDYRAIAAFLTRTHVGRESATKWFCSELVYAAFRAAGVELLRGTHPWEVSPALLARSPRLPRLPSSEIQYR